MQDPPTDPTGEQFREAFGGFAAAAPSSHETMPGTRNSGMKSGGTVPTDGSEHQREPAWPEMPPPWPEAPASSFTPTARSFAERAPQQSEDATATMAGPLPGAAPRRSGRPMPADGPAQPGGPRRSGGPAYGGTPGQAGQGQTPGWAQAGPHGDAFPGGPDRTQTSPPFTPSVRSYAEQAPPASAAPPQPDDPYKPFVTAGQISGPKTPPAHRQQELWNTVFGENYQAIDEYEDDEGGRPVWLYALVASVVAVLIAVLVWAFAAGPLSSGDTAEAATSAQPSPAKKGTTAKPQAQMPRLPVFKGTPSPVTGVITDTAGRITLPKLGGPWQADTDPARIKTTYGFTSRQYVPAGTTAEGKREFAVVMSGRLAQSLAAKYTTPDNLGPVINAVMYRARLTQFPKDNKITKIAQQRLARNGLTGLTAAYKVTAGGETTTVVIAAVNTGADLPTIVYMAVPELTDNLLPDINTVFRSIKPIR